MLDISHRKSMAKVVSGRNKTHQITCKSLIHCSLHTSLSLKRIGKNEVERKGKVHDMRHWLEENWEKTRLDERGRFMTYVTFFEGDWGKQSWMKGEGSWLTSLSLKGTGKKTKKTKVEWKKKVHDIRHFLWRGLGKNEVEWERGRLKWAEFLLLTKHGTFARSDFSANRVWISASVVPWCGKKKKKGGGGGEKMEEVRREGEKEFLTLWQFIVLNSAPWG